MNFSNKSCNCFDACAKIAQIKPKSLSKTVKKSKTKRLSTSFPMIFRILRKLLLVNIKPASTENLSLLVIRCTLDGFLTSGGYTITRPAKPAI